MVHCDLHVGYNVTAGCANFEIDLPNQFVDPFSTWLYTIGAGGNDLLVPIEQGEPIPIVNATLVPQAVGAIAVAVNISKTFFQKSESVALNFQ
jgi:hypothetical protein